MPTQTKTENWPCLGLCYDNLNFKEQAFYVLSCERDFKDLLASAT